MAATLTVGASVYDIRLVGLEDIATPHLGDTYTHDPLRINSKLKLPPAPMLPDPRLNRVVWPVTGLSCHAVGHLLLTDADAATVGTTCTLNLTDGEDDVAREVPLYILDRRPFVDTRPEMDVAPEASDPADPFDGWVVTVVDARYMRRATVASTDTIARTTWGELIHALGTLAGFTMPSAASIQAKVHADFGAPDADTWSPATLAGEGYSLAADAAATAVGLRIVLDAEVFVDTPADSETAYTNWLTYTGRDTFNTGGIKAPRYAAPLKVRCDGVDVSLPSPTPRLGDTESATLYGTGAFATKWVETYSDWLTNTAVTGDVGGLVYPPVTGSTQHVEWDIGTCNTRIVAHPIRWPLPLERADGGGTVLVTANVDGSEESTTARLEFDQDTGIRVDAGATDADPDVVSLVYGPSRNIVTNVCRILDSYGVMTGIKVERTPVTFPAGTTFGTPVCETNPTECCPIVISCPGVPPMTVPNNLCLVFKSRSGIAACLPASAALTTAPPSFTRDTVCGTGAAAALLYFVRDGANQFPNLCGNTGPYTSEGWQLELGIGCAAALDAATIPGPFPEAACITPGSVGDEYYLSLNVSGPSASDTGHPTVPFHAAVYDIALPADTFDTASGELLIGTNTRTGVASSVDVYLSWGDNCGGG